VVETVSRTTTMNCPFWVKP